MWRASSGKLSSLDGRTRRKFGETGVRDSGLRRKRVERGGTEAVGWRCREENAVLRLGQVPLPHKVWCP